MPGMVHESLPGWWCQGAEANASEGLLTIQAKGATLAA